MDPIARFLYNFLNKCTDGMINKNFNEQKFSYMDFFNDKISFLDFVNRVLGLQSNSIEFISNGDDLYGLNLNNLRGLKLLSDNYPRIIDITKPYETKEEIYELFKVIITKILFNINTTKIFNICKNILNRYKIPLNKEEDLLTKENFMTLIYLLLNKKNPTKGEINANNFDKFINGVTFNTVQAKEYKLFVDSSFFEDEKYNFLIYVQIHLMFVLLGYEFDDPIVHFLFKILNRLTKVREMNGIDRDVTIYSFFNTNDYLFHLAHSAEMIGTDEFPPTYNRAKNFKEKNSIILRCLHSFYPNVFPINQSLKTDEDLYNILKTIIDFRFNDSDCIQNLESSSLILKDYGVEVKTMNDLLSPKTIMNLIYIYAMKELPNFEVTLDNFDEKVNEIKMYILSKYFSNLKDRLDEKIEAAHLNDIFINSSFFFDRKYNFLIHIQIFYLLQELLLNYDHIDPIIKTIYFLYPYGFYRTDARDVSSFFDKGYHFPRFVSLALNEGNRIPGVLNIVRNDNDVQHNNSIALKFLIKKAPRVITVKSIESFQDQFQILKEMLSKVIFNIDKNRIIMECRNILPKSSTTFGDVNLLSSIYITDLFRVMLCNGDDQAYKLNDYNFNGRMKFLNKIINNNILFITDDFLYEKYLFLIYIQLHLFFFHNRDDNKDPVILLIGAMYMPIINGIFTGITIDSFFNCGLFSLFIEEILPEEYKQSPFSKILVTNEIENEYKNKCILKYAISKSNVSINRSFNTTQEKLELLKWIIFNLCFDFDQDRLYLLIDRYFVQFNSNRNCKEDQLLNPNSMVRFLKSKYNVQGYDLNSIKPQISHDFHVNLFINNSTFKEPYKFIVYLQVYLILDMDNYNPIKDDLYNESISLEQLRNKPNTFRNDRFAHQNRRPQRQYDRNPMKNPHISYDDDDADCNVKNPHMPSDDNDCVVENPHQSCDDGLDPDELSDDYRGEDQFDLQDENIKSMNQRSNEYQCFLKRDPHYLLNSIDAYKNNKSNSMVYYSDSPLNHYNPEPLQFSPIKDYDEDQINAENNGFDEDTEDENDEVDNNNDSNQKRDSHSAHKSNKFKFKSYQQGFKKALLMTINILGSKAKLHFHHFSESYKNDSIPKFVISFLGLKSLDDDDDGKATDLTKLTNTDIINYLKKIEPKFGTLVFDFNNEKFAESSAILFYTTFLNTYFLKETRKKLLERCLSTINLKHQIKPKKSNFKFTAKYEFDVLTNSLTFDLLLKFVSRYKSRSSKEHLTHLFKKSNIPQIFDKTFLTYCQSQNKVPDVIYYQLQFIFNVFDSNPANRVVQLLISASSLIKKVKLPKFVDILKSVKPKITSLKITSEKVNMKMESGGYNINSNSNNSNKSNAISQRYNYNYNGSNQMDELKRTSAMHFLPFLKRSVYYLNSTFDQRLLKDYVIPIHKNFESKGDMKSTKIESSEKYWNSFNWKLHIDSYEFKKGVLFNKVNEEFENRWNEERDKIQNAVTKIKQSSRKKIDKKSKKISDMTFDQKEQIIKFFVYDDIQGKWKFNLDSFTQYTDQKNLVNSQIRTPLVLFINSSEKESISIVSKFIKHVFPDLDEGNNKNEIFVYGFCDSTLTHLQLNADEKSNKQAYKIKPFFLLLHVPKARQNDPNIKKIVLQIYSFLAYICDVQIVILNKKYFNDQVELITKLNSLYSKKKIEKTFTLQPKSIIKSLSNNNNNANKNDDDDGDRVVMIDDDDSFDEDDDDDDDDNDDVVDVEINSSLLKTSAMNISQKSSSSKPDIIFLLNDSIAGDNEQFNSILKENDFFGRIFSVIKENRFKYHFIDLSDPIFDCFMESFKEFCTNKQTIINDLLKNFKFIQMSEITTEYIQIKNSSNLLEEAINKRYLMYKESNTLNNSIFITSNIKGEIEKIISPFDIELIRDCNKILSKFYIKDDPNRSTIINELAISAEKHIMLMFSKFYDFEIKDSDKMSITKNSHFVFLKKEYFNIVKYLSTPQNFEYYYENNFDILNEQYNADFNLVSEVIDKIVKEWKSIEDMNQNGELNDLVKGSPNYEIRQKEKIQELKAQIAIGRDLKDEIEQDF